MRAVYHPAFYGKHSCVRMSLERGDNRFRVTDFVFGRGESGIDDRHLRRMDRKLASETLLPGGLGFESQSVLIAEVREDSIDRLHAGRDSAGQAL